MDEEKIKQLFRLVMDEEREKHWIDPETHHEHHHFLKGVVWATNIMKKSAIVAFVVGIVTGLGAVVWAGIKALMAIKGAMSG